MTPAERESALNMAHEAMEYIKAHPKCLQAANYDELHDYCDANVIGGQDVYLDRCVERLAAEHPDWDEDLVSEVAWDEIDEVLRHVERIVGEWLEYEHCRKEARK